MIDNQQFRASIIRPTLAKLELASDKAENLLVMVMAHESNGGYYLQQTKGPALGVYQMETATFNDLWRRYLFNKPDLENRLMDSCNLKHIPEPEEMEGNLYLATAMARIFFLRVYTPIPTDLELLSEHIKKFWNTEAGKATAAEYLRDYLKFTAAK